MTERLRYRELGHEIGVFEPGPHNAITDVGEVEVGHSTIVTGEGELVVGQGPVRTGVTAVLPNAGDIFTRRLIGGGFVLNGAGELSGLTQVMEWGLIETPILLTNSLAVGACSEALVDWMVSKHAGIGREHDVVLPLVGECDDSWLNDVAGKHVRPHHVFEALDQARGGPVDEGSVGGGTGMVTCDLAGGIGTSSRIVEIDGNSFTLGTLVMSNFGYLEDLRVDGRPLGRELVERWPGHERRISYGSIICILATDAPLTGHQLSRLAKRAALGIGRAGSMAAHGSGEIVLAFSTANAIPRRYTESIYQLDVLADPFVNPLYQAAIESTEESILNAICKAREVVGRDGHRARALPYDIL